jgi:hypothetical protein
VENKEKGCSQTRDLWRGPRSDKEVEVVEVEEEMEAAPPIRRSGAGIATRLILRPAM